MTKIQTLHTQGLSASEIIECAQADTDLQAELACLIETSLEPSRSPMTLASQARYAMRLPSMGTAKGVRHSEL